MCYTPLALSRGELILYNILFIVFSTVMFSKKIHQLITQPLRSLRLCKKKAAKKNTASYHSIPFSCSQFSSTTKYHTRDQVMRG